MSDTQLIDVHIALQRISSALDRFINLDEYDAVNRHYPMGVPENSIPMIIDKLQEQQNEQ